MKIQINMEKEYQNVIRNLTPVERLVMRTALRNLRVSSTLAMDTAKMLIGLLD